MKLDFTILIFILITLCCAGSALAFPMVGDGVLGDFTGQFNYTAQSSTIATITVMLINTSPAVNGGYLTAFAFNNPNNWISGVALTSTDSDFSLIGNSSFNNSISASPYGSFDIGASISSSFLGGGNPAGGIAVGDSDTFIFNLTGTHLDALTAMSFVSEASEGNGADAGDEFFMARFRGFNDGGSNKTPGSVTPEPATLSLLGIGLAGLLGFKRRKTNN